MNPKEEFRRQLLVTFQAELDDHLKTLNQGLLALEENPPRAEQAALLTELFRAAHSLKGTSRGVGVQDIAAIAHNLEDVLGAIQQAEVTFSPPLFDALFVAVDALRQAMIVYRQGQRLPEKQLKQVLAGLEAVLRGGSETERVAEQVGEETEELAAPPAKAEPENSEEGEPAQSEQKVSLARLPARSAAAEETIRVTTAKVDALMADMGELLVTRMRTEQRLIELRRLGRRLARWQKQWRQARPCYSHLQRRDVDSFNGSFMAEVGEDYEVRDDSINPNPGGPGPILHRPFDTTQRQLVESPADAALCSTRQDVAGSVPNIWESTGGPWGDTPQLRPEVPNSPKIWDTPDVAPLLDFLAVNEEHLRDFDNELNELLRHFGNDYNRLALLADDLQDKVRRVRMLPVATLFDFFPRMVRDLARERGKEIALQIEGAETELDRQVLEALKDPLVHLLRNAVDHGIELPEQRLAAGKPPRGTIWLRAVQKSNTILLEVADDGAGIDLEAVRRAAVEHQLLTALQAPGLTRQASLDLIFRSGLSTQAEVTDLSGRGVGLDVVRQNLERLHGLIQVDTSPGQGVTFSLTLPLTMATSQVLLVEAGGQTVAIPTSTVERILQVDPAQISSLEGKPAIQTNGHPLPLISLAQALELPQADPLLAPGQQLTVVVLGLAEKRIACRIARALGAQEVVIKSLGRQLRRVRNIAGATILGNGQVVMVLNVADLMKATHIGPPVVIASPVQTPDKLSRRRVLVVDDSITTRTLEKNILENAGYRVVVAADGQEAWALVQSEPLQAIVADIDMPRMNGFVLTENVKSDPHYQELPVILVSSLESPQDKIRGMQAGADAYITKGAFDQNELLETISRLIG
jgi:two-component system chemotaxis sensor kinase CheA